MSQIPDILRGLVRERALNRWTEHFLLDGARIIGRTAVGRATVELLRFNDPPRVRVRAELHRVGRYP